MSENAEAEQPQEDSAASATEKPQFRPFSLNESMQGEEEADDGDGDGGGVAQASADRTEDEAGSGGAGTLSVNFTARHEGTFDYNLFDIEGWVASVTFPTVVIVGVPAGKNDLAFNLTKTIFEREWNAVGLRFKAGVENQLTAQSGKNADQLKATFEGSLPGHLSLGLNFTGQLTSAGGKAKVQLNGGLTLNVSF